MGIPTEGVVLINLAAGALLTYAGGAVNQHRQRDARRAEVRREAYGALILALDHLQRVWEAPETMPTTMDDQRMGRATGEAVASIQQAYAAVRLVASKDARAKADAAWSAAWDLSNLLNTPGPKFSRLGPVFDAFTAAAREFVEQAEAECAL